MNNCYALLAAAGLSTRMGDQIAPKPFLMLGRKTVLEYSIKTIEETKLFDGILVMVNESSLGLAKKITARYSNVVVLEGGSTRNETLMNGIQYLLDNKLIDDDTVLMTHDAARPFVSEEEIEDSVAKASEYGAADAAYPASDTMLISADGLIVDDIPDRSHIYNSITPQSFNALKLYKLYNELSDEEKTRLTDGCGIFRLRNEKVALSLGKRENFKITYPADYARACSIVRG